MQGQIQKQSKPDSGLCAEPNLSHREDETVRDSLELVLPAKSDIQGEENHWVPFIQVPSCPGPSGIFYCFEGKFVCRF